MPIAAALALDVVLTVVFATIGRASHAEGITASGVVHTAWPFLVGLLVGWALAAALTARRRTGASGGWARSMTAGVPIWLCTVAVGMVLRRLAGEGTALAFVIVATITLGVLLLGWRAVVLLTARRRAARADSPEPAAGRAPAA
ncbi:DUF3054 domain-containing protein [Cumulibacter manganitolerans]|uniref:DUF3054 domain-containing protein n=1 Tax=Cumulibacter manganitolerans TaxID=1884992 RepID=UPI001297FDE4|nr:DUF3054 domain-containing protein [Cumulibacter manganitolerans]